MRSWQVMPSNPAEDSLYQQGYRVFRNEEYIYRAQSPERHPVYSGRNIEEAWAACERHANPRPTIVCLCGSTRFSEAYQEANLRETLAGRIVLTIGADMKSDHELFADKSPDELAAIKDGLDKLHRYKIDLADEVLVLNVDGYIGDSTQQEIEYAKRQGKRIRFWENP